MSAPKTPFMIKEEDDENVKKMSSNLKAITLCVIAPFAPLRIAPRRSLAASFSYPDEFALEEFVYNVIAKYPKKED